MSDKSTAIAAVEPSAATRPGGIDIGGGNFVTLDSAMALANQLSGAATLPPAYRKAPDIMAAMLTAAQLQLPLMTVINGTHVINGKVTLGADLMVGACRGSGQVASWREGPTKDGYEVDATRTDGTQMKVEFTDADAKAAGLTGGNWQKFRGDMLRARAVSRLCRRLFPDILAGVYSREEMDGDVAPTAPQTVNAAATGPAGYAGFDSLAARYQAIGELADALEARNMLGECNRETKANVASMTGAQVDELTSLARQARSYIQALADAEVSQAAEDDAIDAEFDDAAPSDLEG